MILSKQVIDNSETEFHISPKRMKEILRVERQMDDFLSKKYKWGDDDGI